MVDVGIYICPDRYDSERKLRIHMEAGVELEDILKMPVNKVFLNLTV